jgi:hypothetical protein
VDSVAAVPSCRPQNLNTKAGSGDNDNPESITRTLRVRLPVPMQQYRRRSTVRTRCYPVRFSVFSARPAVAAPALRLFKQFTIMNFKVNIFFDMLGRFFISFSSRWLPSIFKSGRVPAQHREARRMCLDIRIFAEWDRSGPQHSTPHQCPFLPIRRRVLRDTLYF